MSRGEVLFIHFSGILVSLLSFYSHHLFIHLIAWLLIIENTFLRGMVDWSKTYHLREKSPACPQLVGSYSYLVTACVADCEGVGTGLLHIFTAIIGFVITPLAIVWLYICVYSLFYLDYVVRDCIVSIYTTSKVISRLSPYLVCLMLFLMDPTHKNWRLPSYIMYLLTLAIL